MKTFVPFQFPFMDSLHEDHFNSALYEIGSTYPSIVAAIYLLSATRETRAHFWELMDNDGNIKDDLWDVWQDRGTAVGVWRWRSICCMETATPFCLQPISTTRL